MTDCYERKGIKMTTDESCEYCSGCDVCEPYIDGAVYVYAENVNRSGEVWIGDYETYDESRGDIELWAKSEDVAVERAKKLSDSDLQFNRRCSNNILEFFDAEGIS